MSFGVWRIWDAGGDDLYGIEEFGLASCGSGRSSDSRFAVSRRFVSLVSHFWGLARFVGTAGRFSFGRVGHAKKKGFGTHFG